MKLHGPVWIAGVDEAGRGPLAGPVVAAACFFTEPFPIEKCCDSKTLQPQIRRKIFDELCRHPGCIYGVGVVSSQVIDEINILQASLLAMQRAIENLPFPPDEVLVDGNVMPQIPIPGRAIIKGDATEPVIGAASIIAKETRDEMMLRCHEKWPVYGFASHKGYGTKMHIQALIEHGPCPWHRRSFAPVRKVLEERAHLLV